MKVLRYVGFKYCLTQELKRCVQDQVFFYPRSVLPPSYSLQSQKSSVQLLPPHPLLTPHFNCLVKREDFCSTHIHQIIDFDLNYEKHKKVINSEETNLPLVHPSLSPYLWFLNCLVSASPAPLL